MRKCFIERQRPTPTRFEKYQRTRWVKDKPRENAAHVLLILTVLGIIAATIYGVYN